MKQTIRLNEQELKHLIRESVKRVLRETEGQKTEYYWAIGDCDEGDWFEESGNSDDASQPAFPSPAEAYRDGLRNLQAYDGDARLFIFYFEANGAGEYVPDYCAEIHDGKITEY